MLDGGHDADLLIAHIASRQADRASLEEALAQWGDADLNEALAALGQVTDDEDNDRVRAKRGDQSA